jgi:acyl-coenzyme A synthetase/AMP-(fatty) acid ligase
LQGPQIRPDGKGEIQREIKHVLFAEALPKNALGKVLRYQLRQTLAPAEES